MTAKTIIEIIVCECDHVFYDNDTKDEIREVMDQEEYEDDELEVKDTEELLAIIDEAFIPELKAYVFESSDLDDNDIDMIMKEPKAYVLEWSDWDDDIDMIVGMIEAGLVQEGKRRLRAYHILKNTWYDGTWRTATLSNIKHAIHSERDKNFVWKQLD